MKKNQRTSESEVRIFRTQNSNVVARYLDIFTDVDSRSTCSLNPGCIALIGQKRDLSRLCLVESGRAFYFYVPVTCITARSGLRGELGQSPGVSLDTAREETSRTS